MIGVDADKLQNDSTDIFTFQVNLVFLIGD